MSGNISDKKNGSRCSICHNYTSNCTECGKDISNSNTFLCMDKGSEHFCSSGCAHEFMKKRGNNYKYTDEDGKTSHHYNNPGTNSSGNNSNTTNPPSKNTYNNQTTNNNTNNSSNSGSSSRGFDKDSALTAFFWFAIIFHIIDAYTGFDRNPGLAMYIYPIMFVFAVFFLFDMKYSSEEIPLMIVMVLTYMLPKFMDLIQMPSWMDAVTGIVALFPLLPLYIALKASENHSVNKIIRWYIFIWMLIMVIFIINSYGINASDVTNNKDVKSGVLFIGKGVVTTVNDFSTGINKIFERSVTKATGQQYGGDEESKVGIYVEGVRPLESRYTSLSNVFVQAKIRAINVKEPMNISTYCFIEGVNQGTVSPSLLANVEGNYENSVSCNLGKLPEGTYNARVMINFQFESSSDITYTFVDTNVKSDQYASMGISRTTTATYTGGPVELGLPSLSQPLRVNIKNPDAEIGAYPFGVSLTNKWNQGRIVRGKKYILNIPSEISLYDCSRDYLEAVPVDADRTEYTFVVDTTQAQDVFDGITCRMKFDDPRALLDGNLKNTKTFAARATYDYSVEAVTTIKIDKP